jgi:hypothetical protein
MRWLAILLVCCGSAAADTVPLPRAKPLADEPATIFEAIELNTAPSECRARLSGLAEIEPLPHLVGPGVCGGGDMVRITAVRLRDGARVAIAPAAELRCEMASALADFVRNDAAPNLGPARLATVENFDAYDCRGRNRVAGAKISEHGKGNAIDIRAFRLANNRSVSPTDVNVPRELRAKLKEAACARFTTVLGPGSDGYHEGHIHLDLAARRNNARMCQWELRDPPPAGQIAGPIPLPRPRPDMGAAGNDKSRL